MVGIRKRIYYYIRLENMNQKPQRWMFIKMLNNQNRDQEE